MQSCKRCPAVVCCGITRANSWRSQVHTSSSPRPQWTRNSDGGCLGGGKGQAGGCLKARGVDLRGSRTHQDPTSLSPHTPPDSPQIYTSLNNWCRFRETHWQPSSFQGRKSKMLLPFLGHLITHSPLHRIQDSLYGLARDRIGL